MASIREKLAELRKAEKARSEHRPGTKAYQKANGKVQNIRAWLKRNKAEPGIKQTEAQPVLEGFFSAVGSPRLVDLINREINNLVQKEILTLAEHGDADGIKELATYLKKKAQ